MTAPALARLHAVEKRYGDKTRALRGVDLDIAGGEVLALIGANGSGKTTLLHILAGTVTATTGQVLVSGQPVGARRSVALKRDFGIASQDQALDPEMSAHETLGLFAGLFGLSRAGRDQRIDQAVRIMALEQFLHRRIARLSGGQRQRVHLALLVLQQPSVMLLDEPMGPLDPAMRAHLWQQLRTLLTPARSIVTATHDLSDVESYADRVVVLSDGKILAAGSPPELRHRYARPRLQIRFAPGEIIPAGLALEIADMTGVEQASVRGSTLQVRFGGDADDASRVTGKLRQARVRIDEIREYAATLTEAYYGITGALNAAADDLSYGAGKAHSKAGRKPL